MTQRLSPAGRFARLALALRLALVAALLAVSSAPVASVAAQAGEHCAIAAPANQDGQHAAAKHDSAHRPACDQSCPMHLALTPDLDTDFIPAPPAPAPDETPRVLKSRTPPSPERPPRSLSA